MIVAITGATGFVGQAVLEEAAKRGLGVRALTRREQDAREGVVWVKGDLAAHDALRELVTGADAVLHVAGVVNAPDRAGFLAGNVAGTQAVVDAALGAGTQRLIHVSSLAAREPGVSVYGHTKRLAEEIVQTSGLDWTIVRPPAVYGPRDTEMLELFRAARWRVLPMPPAGRASFIHVADLARLLLDLISANETTQCIFEPDDGRDGGWGHEETAKAIGCAVGRNVWAPAIPARLLLAAGRLDKAVRGEGAKLTPDRASYMAHPDWVSSPERKVPPSIWTPKFDTRQGLVETARWYREQGWLK